MKKKSFLIDAIEVIGLSLLITFLLFKFVMISAKVNGSSMYPTLKDGYFGYSFVASRNIGISRFDICVIDVDGKKLVKRVIGLPNEKIECIDSRLYINGEYIDDYVNEDVYTSDFSYELDEDEYFCLGDNREVSKDSRYYGSFNKDNIVSTHLFVVYPFSELGFKN